MNIMQTAISLGFNCEAAATAIDRGIRNRKEEGYLTCPFDTCLTNYNGIVECIKDNFKYFCDSNFLTLVSPYKDCINNNGTGIYTKDTLVYNTKYKFIFNHESPEHEDLYLKQGWLGGKMHFIDNNFQAFRERYTRRINNFRKYIETSTKITFILGNFNTDIHELNKELTYAYPKLNYTILHYTPSCVRRFYDDVHSVMGYV